MLLEFELGDVNAKRDFFPAEITAGLVGRAENVSAHFVPVSHDGVWRLSGSISPLFFRRVCSRVTKIRHSFHVGTTKSGLVLISPFPLQKASVHGDMSLASLSR